MNAMTRIGGFGLALAVLFGVSYVVGTTIGPSQDGDRSGGTDGHEISAAAGGAAGGGADDMLDALRPGGLAISEGGYTFDPDELTWPAGRSRAYTFRIIGPDGRPLTAYTRAHEADLHLIVVRRDLTGYQHLHPTRDAAGTWSVPLRLAAPGVYRVFADFAPAVSGAGGHASDTPDGAPASMTLGADVTVGGNLAPTALPAPSTTATVAGGYTVTMSGEADRREGSELAFVVARNGRPVTDLEEYLGALGHLVVLREGDLAYLHSHPLTRTRPPTATATASATAGAGPAGAAATSAATGDGDEDGDSALSFATRFPSAGSYRLFLDFRHAGQVRTAEFTMTVAEGGGVSTPGPAGTRPPQHTH
ncbi:hypothetical protein CC117_13305 [Parafrankia colletiae]|uniref:Secreted protein n=2 Tax=Parafrankia colletiae TaxID=573497 RepID=A0A1S1R2K4_9ACTN|nr:hypothetical protein [Frankia sp. Cpl3]OHV41168.1 hypothetical protein CC117_13305 [Parafrankia colletiae]